MATGSFANAILSPFDPAAEGAQIPDYYSFPTNTAHLKTSFKITSDATGDVDWAFLPSLLASVYTNHGLMVSGLPTQLLYPTQQLPVATTTNAAINSIVTQSQLAAFDTYRLVGAGMRLRSMLIPQTSTGTLYAASFPAGPRLINAFEPNLVSNLVGQQSVNGINLPQLQVLNHFPPIQTTLTSGATLFDQAFQAHPTAKVIEHYELNQNGLEVALKPVDGRWCNWRSATNATVVGGASNASYGDSVIITATGVPIASTAIYEPAWEDSAGWSAFYFRGTGFPANTTLFTAEIIYHIEYIPPTASLLSAANFPPVNKNMLDEVLDAAAKMPLYRSLRDATGAQAQQMVSRLGF